MTQQPVKRITINLPSHLLKDAQSFTKTGITETVVEGLLRLKRASAGKKLKALRGKIHLDIDLDISRERRH